MLSSTFSQKLSVNRFWIPFTDKNGNACSLAEPEKFLSDRAISRRIRHDVHITEEDMPVSKIYTDSLSGLGLKVIGTSRWFNAAVVETSDTAILGSLRGISFIRDFSYLKPLRTSELAYSCDLRNEQGFMSPFMMNSSYGRAEKQISILHGRELHSMGYRGEGVIIAVFDCGFFNLNLYPAFDSIWQNNKILDWKDLADPDNPAFFQGDAHGMSVLSTIGANIPGDIVGTAPDASFILLRSEVTSSEYTIEEASWLLAAEYADSAGADIINSSLGYYTFDDTAMNYSVHDMDGNTALSTIAAEKAFSKGIIVVSSAGNEGNKPWKKIVAPADGKNVLAVGAVDTFLNPAAFSSCGPSADYRIKPDVAAVGLNAAIVTASGLSGNGNGTSYSCPQIAGMMACLLQAAPEKKNYELADAVKRSASHYYSPGNIIGYGIPDFLKALQLLRISEQPFPEHMMLIIPNPNYGIFEIKLADLPGKIIKICIYDLMGRIISEIREPEIRSGYIWIDQMVSAKPGMYYITVFTDKMNYSAKMMKIE